MMILICFQLSVIPALASSIIFDQGHHTGISEIYTYDENEILLCVEADHIGGLSRVLSIKEVRSDHEVLAGVASVAAKTSIQAANGLKITGFTGHGVNRAIGSAGRMGIKPNAILDALKNPLKINNVVTDQLGRQSQRFIGGQTTKSRFPPFWRYCFYKCLQERCFFSHCPVFQYSPDASP